VKLGLPVDIVRDGPAELATVGRLRDAGLLSWVELRLPRSIEPPDPWTAERAAALASDLWVEVSLHSEACTFAAHVDAGVRAHVLEALNRTIDLARETGARLITIHPPLSGAVGIDRMTGARWSDDERALLAGATRDEGEAEEWFRELLLGVAEELAAFRAVLAIENMRPHRHVVRLNQVREIARLVGGLDRPEVRMCIDVRKACREGMDAAGFLRERGDLVANVHVGESPEAWPALAGALSDIAYGGPVIYEGSTDLAEESLASMRSGLVGANADHVGGV
jgi:sugar phosphate isomerase/epimerase